MAESGDGRPALVERIRGAMANAGITQRQLAERSGVNLRTLQEYLAARSRIPADALPGIAKVLDVSTDWLLMGVPATLLPSVLWGALIRAFASPAAKDPASADFVHQLYLSYTEEYFATYAKTASVRDWEPIVRAFVDRLHDESDPAIAALRWATTP